MCPLWPQCIFESGVCSLALVHLKIAEAAGSRTNLLREMFRPKLSILRLDGSVQVAPPPSEDPDALLERLQERVGNGKFTGKGDRDMVVSQLRMLDWSTPPPQLEPGPCGRASELTLWYVSWRRQS